MISADHVTKVFKFYKKPSDRLKEIVLRRPFHNSFCAVNDVSFQVSPGETLGIVGENGAGKSTILKLLTGILIPDTGSVTISGKITGLLELGTGFNPEFSGIDNIFHNAAYLGLTRREIKERLERIIEFTELKSFIQEPLKTYSSGMVMRLAFSVAIHAEPQAFVVDEALSVGDAYFQQKCMKKIKSFKQNGGSIVFVSHDMNAVKILCDRALLLEQGRVIEAGEPEVVINAYNFLIAGRSKDNEVEYIPNPTGTGYGNRKVIIDQVHLLDEHRRPVSVIISGRPLEIALDLTAASTMDNITIGIMIRDTFGRDIFGTNSYHLKKSVAINGQGTTRVAYAFDQFNLGPGKYTITVAAHAGPSHVDECFHWLDRGAAFEVVAGEGPVFAGLVRLEPQLKVGALPEKATEPEQAY